MRRTGPAHGPDRLRQETSATVAADHQQLGVAALLDKDLCRRPEFDCHAQASRPIFAEGPVERFVSQPRSRFLQLLGELFISQIQVRGNVEVGSPYACDGFKGGIEAIGHAACQPERIGRVFRAVDANDDPGRCCLGVHVSTVPVRRLRDKGLRSHAGPSHVPNALMHKVGGQDGRDGQHCEQGAKRRRRSLAQDGRNRGDEQEDQ